MFRKLFFVFTILVVASYNLVAFSLTKDRLRISGYTRNIRGEMGETIGRNYLETLEKGSWQSITPRIKPQGLDLISLRFNGQRIDVIVAECKFSDNPNSISSLLKNTTNSGRQMSMKWVHDRIVNDILPNYEITSNKVSFRKPVNEVDQFSISNDTFLYKEDGIQYYYTKDGKPRSIDYVVDQTNMTKKALEGAAEGYNLRRRLLVCHAENGEIKQAVYDITDFSDTVDNANKPGLTVLVKDGDNSPLRLVKLGEDLTVDEKVLNSFDDECWIDFLRKRGLKADRELVQSLSLKEKATLLQFKNAVIDEQLFNKLYQGDNVAIINRANGFASNDKIFSYSSLTSAERAKIINNLELPEDVINKVDNVFKANRLLRSSSIMAGIGFVVGSGVELISSLIYDDTIDWTQVAIGGFKSGLLMGASSIPISLATEFSEYMFSNVLNGIKLFSSFSESAIESVSNSAIKVVGKRAASGALKSIIPSAVGAVIGLSMDAFSSRGLSPELRRAVMKRSIMIESIAFAVSIGLDAAVSVITGGSGTLAIGIISGIFEMGISMGLELLIPMPDELNPSVIKKQYENNPDIVIEWAKAALEGAY